MFFSTMETGSLDEIARQMLLSAWSPIVWDGGRRAKAWFSYSDFCALDFDNGEWSTDDAAAMLTKNGMAGIVGTTRSHRLVKDGQPACDRFRIVMPWETRLHDRAAYEQNMARLMTHMPADRACKDGGRFFWPCGHIVFIQDGAPLAWKPFTKPKPSRTAMVDMQLHRVPDWMRAELECGVPIGGRNKTAFRFAIKLKERGFSQDEALGILSCGIDLDRSELAGAISNAFKTT